MGNCEFCACVASLPCFSQGEPELSSSQHTILRNEDDSCEKQNFIRTNVELSAASSTSAYNQLQMPNPPNKYIQRADECIICLEEFSTDNPKVKTLCKCGENRSSFHYPCLLYWLEHKSSCPNCSSSIFFQEEPLE
eukprot:gene39072-47534_t